MLRKLVVAAVAAAVLGLAPKPLVAQSLGEVAAKEKAKKQQQQQKKAPKVLTEDDLRSAGAKGTVSVASEPAAGEEAAKPATATGEQKPAAAKPEPTEEEKRAADEKEWRDKLQTAQAEVARLKTQVDKIQANLNDPNLSFYGSGRPQLMSQLEEAKKQLATSEQAVSDLQDAGRRSAFRP
ncbi:MAG TPA: hypothetical protein VGQ78_03360 [Vicinamibacteria bacterium]|jgi:small-conductance mechanosensitive channel|nr:hypothetical protein [Vicinamibacteria bacterium]